MDNASWKNWPIFFSSLSRTRTNENYHSTTYRIVLTSLLTLKTNLPIFTVFQISSLNGFPPLTTKLALNLSDNVSNCSCWNKYTRSIIKGSSHLRAWSKWCHWGNFGALWDSCVTGATRCLSVLLSVFHAQTSYYLAVKFPGSVLCSVSFLLIMVKQLLLHKKANVPQLSSFKLWGQIP